MSSEFKMGFSMQERKLNYLSNIEIFQDLTQGELEAMDRQITMSTCEPGRIFYMPEETGEVLLAVVFPFGALDQTSFCCSLHRIVGPVALWDVVKVRCQ